MKNGKLQNRSRSFKEFDDLKEEIYGINRNEGMLTSNEESASIPNGFMAIAILMTCSSKDLFGLIINQT